MVLLWCIIALTKLTPRFLVLRKVMEVKYKQHWQNGLVYVLSPMSSSVETTLVAVTVCPCSLKCSPSSLIQAKKARSCIFLVTVYLVYC